MSVTPIPDRLSRLREVMGRAGVQAVIVNAGDPHVSEYPAARWEGRRWLSGFTGSLASLVVFAEHVYLLPEPLYWEQAEQQLAGTGIELVRHPQGSLAGLVQWLPEHLKAGDRVAVDGKCLPLTLGQQLMRALQDVGATLCAELDLLGEVWTDRPGAPDAPVFEHEMAQADTPRAIKLARLREAMSALGVTDHLISSLEDIAWLTNLRGNDSPNTPVFLAHMLVCKQRAALFTDASRLPAGLEERLRAEGFDVRPYERTAFTLGQLGEGESLLLDPRRVTLGLRQAIGSGCRVVEGLNPTVLAKSRKSAGEVSMIRAAMVEDGIAMCEFYAGMEQTLARGDRITEIDIHRGLTRERALRPGWIKPSFPTIAGFNAHAALPHYVATPDSDAVLEGSGLLLVDSGGQYFGATTDITRMWPIGDISPAMQRDVTMVLKSHIAMTRLVFPRGTLSTMLDAVARVPMWAQGMNYHHGTGHGVGFCLGVHEGPQTFRQAIPEPSMAMEPGMVTSIEPALYRPSQWGARIENLVLTVPARVPEGETYGEFLAFETLTMCPIDVRCLDLTLLDAVEQRWLDGYHATVRERLLPHLAGAARQWLLKRTQPVSAG